MFIYYLCCLYWENTVSKVLQPRTICETRAQRFSSMELHKPINNVHIVFCFVKSFFL